MVAIKPQHAKALLTQPDPGLTAFLIYGSDVGLVSERAVRLAQSLAARETPRGEVVSIDDPDLEEDSERLSVELLTMPMFGGRKIVRATMGRRINGVLLRGILEGPPLAGVLIVEGGNLRADDTARQAFEKRAHAAAIPCFADDAQSLDEVINEVLAAHHLSITPDAREMLLARLGADRALSRGEVEKLALFAAGRGTIEAEAVEAIVGDASELAMERVIDAAAAGDSTRAIEGCQRLLASGEGAQSVIAAVQWHFARLHRIRAAIEAGRSLDEALRQIRPPIHYKRRTAIEAQCRRWTAPKLAAALARIRASALAARSTSSLEDAHAERLLMELARLATARDTSSRRA